jgi:hypothetical protein
MSAPIVKPSVTTVISKILASPFTFEPASVIARPDFFNAVSDPSGISIQVGHFAKQVAGSLIKIPSPLPYQATNIVCNAEAFIDSATPLCALLIEVTSKFVDSEGWVYPGNFQFNLSKNWAPETGSPFVSSGLGLIPPIPYTPFKLSIDFSLDYVAKTITTNGFTYDGLLYLIGKTTPAVQLKWSPLQIVTQLQLTTNGRYGAGFTVHYNSLTYNLSN